MQVRLIPANVAALAHAAESAPDEPTRRLGARLRALAGRALRDPYLTAGPVLTMFPALGERFRGLMTESYEIR